MDLAAQKNKLKAILEERVKKEGIRGTAPIPDPVDAAVEKANRDTAVLFLRQDRMKRVLAREALSKIEEGTYEVCSWCDGPIKPKRLAAIPEAILCISCQERQERGEFSLTGIIAEEEAALFQA